MQNRRCSVCDGRGYTYQSTIPMTNPINFVFAVIEAFNPYGGRKVVCWRCRGARYYQPIKRTRLR